MNTFLALVVMIALLGSIWSLLERNHRRTAGWPGTPFGADPRCDVDLLRMQHDLDVGRRGRVA